MKSLTDIPFILSLSGDISPGMDLSSRSIKLFVKKPGDSTGYYGWNYGYICSERPKLLGGP